MDQDLMRAGISLPENLPNKFDEMILQRGYSSRSEGVRDAIRSYIVNFEWMSDVQGERIQSSLDQDNCLDIVVLRGEGQDVRKADERMMALKGVKHVKLTTASPGKELQPSFFCITS